MSAVFPFHKPLVLGHRGDCAHAPENTIAAFRQALEAGADGIELDARLTRDKVVMVLHDAGVDRVSNGHGRLASMTQAEVEQLDAGASFDRRFAGEQIPTLQKVFETFGSRLIYDLEIKNFDAPFNGLESRVLELVQRFGLEQRVIVTSLTRGRCISSDSDFPRRRSGCFCWAADWVVWKRPYSAVGHPMVWLGWPLANSTRVLLPVKKGEKSWSGG